MTEMTNMSPNKALCEKGDFTRIGECMRESGTALISKLGIIKAYGCWCRLAV